jgi:hypothetical protein
MMNRQLGKSFNEHSNNRPTLTTLRNAYLLWPFTSVAGQDYTSPIFLVGAHPL